MNVVSVVGARPQIVKAWSVSRAFRAAGINESLVHSGQHSDDAMSRVFFDELDLPEPAFNLGIGSGSHAEQTGRMMIALERAIIELAPDCVVVYGDTNTTLAAALVTCKLRIPLVHVEAGLRSYNRSMPEEHNRVLTDHCADLLLCPTRTAVENLEREGIASGVHLVGDVMYDAALYFGARAREHSLVLEELDLSPGEYFLVTLHRPQNADQPENLKTILEALVALDAPVVFPVHPRTRARFAEQNDLMSILKSGGIRVTEPRSYLDMLRLEQSARAILTDSGGVQKEAFFFRVPCVTLRTETEWPETVATGWNVLVGAHTEAIVEAAKNVRTPAEKTCTEFGDGHAGAKIAQVTSDAVELRPRQ